MQRLGLRVELALDGLGEHFAEAVGVKHVLHLEVDGDLLALAQLALAVERVLKVLVVELQRGL